MYTIFPSSINEIFLTEVQKGSFQSDFTLTMSNSNELAERTFTSDIP